MWSVLVQPLGELVENPEVMMRLVVVLGEGV